MYKAVHVQAMLKSVVRFLHSKGLYEEAANYVKREYHVSLRKWYTDQVKLDKWFNKGEENAIEEREIE